MGFFDGLFLFASGIFISVALISTRRPEGVIIGCVVVMITLVVMCLGLA